MKFIIVGKTTQVKVNILIRSMGPISEMKMVELVIKCEKAGDYSFQAYSMDCYFRQYWRDERLSFKESLPRYSDSSLISHLPRAWKTTPTTSWSTSWASTWPCWRRSGSRVRETRWSMSNFTNSSSQTLTSTMVLTPTSMPSPDPTSCWGSQRTET